MIQGRHCLTREVATTKEDTLDLTMYKTAKSAKSKTMNRRELLKLTPVVALGAFAIPALRRPLLKGGLAFSDWASGKLFRPGHLAARNS